MKKQVLKYFPTKKANRGKQLLWETGILINKEPD